MAKHTPGPWAVYRRHLSARHYEKGVAVSPYLPWFVSPESEADKQYGAATDEKKDRAYAQVICGFGSGYRYKSDEEVWANARLIAAAPELVDSCFELHNALATAMRLMVAHDLVDDFIRGARALRIEDGVGTRAAALIRKVTEAA